MILRLLFAFLLFLGIYSNVDCMEGGFLDQLSDFSSSTSSQPIDELPAVVDIKAPFVKCLSGGIHIIAWDVRQGNFVIIKNDKTKSLVIVDCGSSNLPYKNFEEMHMEEMINLFHGSKLDSVIITHPDNDHYSFLCEGLLQFVKQYGAISPEVTFFLGGGLKNQKCEQKCLLAFQKVCTKPRMYSCDILENSFLCRDIINNKIIQMDTIEEEINSKFFMGKCDIDDGFSFCKPILGIPGKSSTNDQSLVFDLYCNGGRILFTGDATEKTFKAIGYDVKEHSLVPLLDPDIIGLQKYNYSIISRCNFVVIPHHGAHTAGSDLILSEIIAAAGTNYVGAVILANPEYSGPGHPTKDALAIPFPISAQQEDRLVLVRHKKKGDKMHQITTHRILYTPCLLPGGFLWLKLNNGLSVFMNNRYVENPNSDSVSFFRYLTFKSIYDERPENSLHDYLDSVIWKYVNIENIKSFPEALCDSYQIIISIMLGGSASFFYDNQFDTNFFNILSPISKTLLLFTVRLITGDKELSKSEKALKEILIEKYGRMSKRYNFKKVVQFLFDLDDPALIPELSSENIEYILSVLK